MGNRARKDVHSHGKLKLKEKQSTNLKPGKQEMFQRRDKERIDTKATTQEEAN